MNGISRHIAKVKSATKGNIWKTLGPGILFASTAIGVSHLVQSTRAGAFYGFGLLWAVVLANLMKYPFFEFGSRYANATGTSLLDGYHRLGKWVLWTYALITLGSMFFVSAAVTAVTSGFLDNLFAISQHTGVDLAIISALILLVCAIILSRGRFSVLDSLIKVIASVLLLTTVVAFVLTLAHGPVAQDISLEFILPEDAIGIAFLIALMGWMPTAVDLSTWNSLWTVARIRQTGYRPALKETLFDFNLGYVISALLALCFITMGSYLFYDTGTELSTSGAGFAHQVITMYTSTIGEWSYIIVASAGFAIMFGTSIAVLDGYARAMDHTAHLLLHGPEGSGERSKTYGRTLWILVLGTFGIIYFLGTSIPDLVDLATTISFLIAPFIAIVNLILVHRPFVAAEFVPPLWLRLLAFCGVLFLTGFSLFFLTR
ncbi:MAG: Nramp family divalent metal transporter [Flavobacteriales bacterium]|nr:Nramp family divalent metal transporter [Flavobacteriales bacterium]